MESRPSSSSFPPLSVAFPLYLTRFVGREQERVALGALLLQKRLLTLVGAGGIGKTRLAIHVASDAYASFPDGVCMVELAALSDPERVPHAIASVLNIRTDRDAPILTLLIQALCERHALLILDNCEHLIAGCASLVEALLQACPHVSILATSREPLAVVGEVIWRVAALSSPHFEQYSSAEELSDYEAIQLFCERATDNYPRFHLTEQNAPIVARICYQLDGLPLALELAAALLPALSLDQLAARLNDRFALLKHGKRTASPRQQTLQATLDWSYALLTGEEQDLFQRLAIFAGCWTLTAVEQVCVSIDAALDSIYDGLVHLVNKSLIMVEEDEGTGEVHYRFLDTMHQYALEKLQQSGRWSQMCEQHYRWCVQVVEQVNTHLSGATQVSWLQYLEAEQANMQAALQRAIADGRFDAAAQLADALRRFWIVRNHFSEGRYWFETLLAVGEDDQRLSLAMRVRVLFGASEFARYQGAYDHTCSLLQRQIALLEALDDVAGLAEAQSYLGLVLGLQGDFEQSMQLCQESLVFYRTSGQYEGLAATLTTLAFATLSHGDFQQAIALSEEVCYVLRGAGAEQHIHFLYALFVLAQAALAQGDKGRAHAACREAFHRTQAQGQTYGLSASLGLIGGLAGLEGQPAQAARLFGAAQALLKRLQAPHPPTGRALQERMVLFVRSALGNEQFMVHYSAGQSCSMEQILLEAEAVLQLRISPASAGGLETPATALPALSTLSQREREILALVATGLTDAQVADYLRLSPRTVSKHLQSIYCKLDINTRSAATHIALKHGLI